MAVSPINFGYRSLISVLLLLILSYGPLHSQDSFGLGFIGQREPINQRTGLDLSYNGYYYINSPFSLSFDMAFLPEKPDYFGYVLRIIADDHNIDLLFRPRTDSGEFYIVYGEGETEVLVDSDRNSLFEHWNHVEFDFDPTSDNLKFIFDGREALIDSIGISGSRKYKFLFGLNTFGKYATTDLPPMKLRNVRINIRQKEKYFWPLNEHSGNVTRDSLHGREAYIINPVWLKPLHTTWTLAYEVDSNEGVQIAFNPETNIVYLVSSDHLTEYNLISGEARRVTYSDGTYLMATGVQVIYDTLNNNLYSYSVDRKQLFRFDFDKNSWEGQYANTLPLTLYWHHNKFLSYADTSIYIFNGYGQLRYRNDVFRLYLTDNKWERVAFSGDPIMPRYLAGLGYNKRQDSVYIAGGYGSASGDQLINPHGYNDLYVISMRSREIKKLADYRLMGDDEFCFAGSLVVDDSSHLFYGMIYPKNKPNDKLQLIEASLLKGEYRHVGSAIPYRFYDIVSSADLFYAADLETLVAVSQQQLDKQIHVSIHTLMFPPAQVEAELINSSLLIYYIAGFTLILIAAVFILTGFKKRRLRQRASIKPDNRAMQNAEQEIRILNHQEERHHNAILLFGGFQVFNRKGSDVTRSFTPILTKLFLSILLNSFRDGKGLTSGTLVNLIWSGREERSAKNTLAVNIIRLRRILMELDGCQLTNETRYWKFEFDPKILYVDYYDYLVITYGGGVHDRSQVKRLIRLFQAGSPLKDISFEGADTFKAEVSNKATDFLWHFVKTLDIEGDADVIIEVCNTIFIFDELDEDAMILKCQALLKAGKHSLAVQCFENFKRLYLELYGEEFGKSYKDIFGVDPA